MKVGIVQIRSTDDLFQNLHLVQDFIKEAVQKKCDLICFPENIFYRGPRKKIKSGHTLRLNKKGRLIPDSDFSKILNGFMVDWPIFVSLGSVLERSSDPKRPYNSHWFVAPGGVVETSYRKIHLFNYRPGKLNYEEAKDVTPGKEMKHIYRRPFKFGLSICYDLRFPELYRRLNVEHGANAFLIPAAFTRETGKLHWHTLLKARAVENLSYVIAPAQWGSQLNDQGQKQFAYGHSLAVDPWGKTIVEAEGSGNAFLTLKLDIEQIKKRRAGMTMKAPLMTFGHK
jgi:predicted amidohydrolase